MRHEWNTIRAENAEAFSWVFVTGTARVLRGGSWINNGRNTRSARRNANEPDRRNNNVGFRLALAQVVVAMALDQMNIRSVAMRRRIENALRQVSRAISERLPKRRLARTTQ